MKRAAFAAVVVLSVVALAESNLLSQPTAQRATDAALPNLGSATIDVRRLLDTPGGDREEELLRRSSASSSK